MPWAEGQKVNVVQGGEVLRVAVVLHVDKAGAARINGGNVYRADGAARDPDMRHHGYRIEALDLGNQHAGL